MIALTADNFEQEVIKADMPVLVDFWAEWCAPCHMLTPALNELAEEYKEKLKVCKLNVDDAQDIASQYGIMSIPTVIIFKKGEVAGQMVGAVPKEKLVEFIKPYV